MFGIELSTDDVAIGPRNQLVVLQTDVQRKEAQRRLAQAIGVGFDLPADYYFSESEGPFDHHCVGIS
ncbi:unannotated protein [freshwater metagenome]|uniref:Unannotated protein n=1 Tax=freshwater metagenome TaxID=449393 RepID=A0A6J6Y975_9ZZZZ